MGRVRIQLKKIENKTYRHITFAKRKSGLVKKAYELSTLCDVEVALIIFSPAGKLILFDGKKRVEEILMHYIDLPHHQRGRLQDQELVRQIIAQMSLEAELRHQIVSSGDRARKMSIDSQLEETKNEIRICNSELEEVEKQLQYFVRSPSCIKSISEADFHEHILEDTLKLVSIHKQALEAKRAIQLTYNSEKPLRPQTAGACRSFNMGSSNYCLDWPQQHDTQILMTSNVANSTRFQSLRSHSQPSVEMLPSSSLYLRGARYPIGNAVSRGSEFDGYICQSEYDKFYSADFPLGMNNVHQGRATKTAGPSKVVDGTVAYQYHGNCSHHDCGNTPCPF